MGSIFISYSRKQYYFAESLALALQAQGLDIWFDTYRLEPGCNWQQTIAAGVQECSALVLVASRDSFSSPYCVAECREAIKRNVPVYLVLFEAVELPSDLQGVSIVDMRRRFNKNIPLLASLLQMKTPYRDPLPRPNSWRFPTGMPLGIWLPFLTLVTSITLLTVFFFHELFTVVASPLGQSLQELQRGSSPALVFQVLILGLVPIVVVISLILQVHFAWRFVSRKPYYYRTFVSVLFLGPTILGNQVNAILKNVPAELSTNPTIGLVWLVISLAVFVGMMTILIYFYIEISGRTGVLLRWMPTGRAPEWLRRRCNKRWIKQMKTLQSLGVAHQHYYQLVYTPADVGIATEIRDVLTQQGYHVSDYPTADTVKVLVMSRHTPYSWLQQQLQYMMHTPICVITSSIQLLSDDQSFHFFQWIDYRTHERDQLLASWNPRQLVWGKKIILPMLPENITSYKVPEKLFIPLYLFGAAISSMFAVNLVSLVIALLLYPGDPVPALLGVIGLASVGGLMWVVSKVWVEDITPAMTIMLMILYFSGNAVLWAIISPYFAIAPAIYLALFFILLPFTWRALHRWLPKQFPPELPHHESRLAPPTFRLVGSFLGLFIVIGLWSSYQFSITMLGLPIAPNEAYTAIVPGPGCDSGPGLWEEVTSDSYSITCTVDGLTLQQTTPAMTSAYEVFQSTRVFPMTFPASYHAEVMVHIGSPTSTPPSIGMIVSTTGNSAAQCLNPASIDGAISIDVHGNEISCSVAGTITTSNMIATQTYPPGIYLVFTEGTQPSPNVMVSFSNFKYWPLPDTGT